MAFARCSGFNPRIQSGRFGRGNLEFALIVAPPFARGKGTVSNPPKELFFVTVTYRPYALMMKKQRRIRKLTVETERTFIFRTRSDSRAGLCERCGTEVELMPVADAARDAGRSELAIYQLIQAGSLHFLEDDEGHILVCFSSLRRIQQRLDQGSNKGEGHET